MSSFKLFRCHTKKKIPSKTPSLNWFCLLTLFFATIEATSQDSGSDSDSAGTIVFEQTRFEIAVASGYDHVPLRVSLPNGMNLIGVLANVDWAHPRIDKVNLELVVEFSTRSLTGNQSATITVQHDQGEEELVILVTVSPLRILRFVEDSTRPIVYGIHRNRKELGCVVRYDPYEKRALDCLTVGKDPTDFALNEQDDELMVVNHLGRRIDVIDLEKFDIKTEYLLDKFKLYQDGIFGVASANIELGPGRKVYYVDSSDEPVLHLLDLETGQTIQSPVVDQNGIYLPIGFMDIGVNSDRTTMIAMPQDGWTTFERAAVIYHFSFSDEGLVIQDTIRNLNPDLFQNEPLEAPVLFSKDDAIAIVNRVAVKAENINDTVQIFPATVWSMTPHAELVATHDAIYDFNTAKQLFVFDDTHPFDYQGANQVAAQVFLSDYSKFLYFDRNAGRINSVDLMGQVFNNTAIIHFSPDDGSVIQQPSRLSWDAIMCAQEYDVYLGDSKAKVEMADVNFSEYIGRVRGHEIDVVQFFESNQNYYWRVDPVTPAGALQGRVNEFTVKHIELNYESLDLVATQGPARLTVHFELKTSNVHSFQLFCESDWISFSSAQGSTPGSFDVFLDASGLSIGNHFSEIVLNVGDEVLTIPVKLNVAPLAVALLRSDPHSSLVYGISERPGFPAYLLEIDSETETITRALEVGTSVTDLAIHHDDNRIYITNWLESRIWAVNRDQFKVEQFFDYVAYQLSTGRSGSFLMQNFNGPVYLVDSQSGEILSQGSAYSGGGETSPGGDIYYHGESNITAAPIRMFDLSQDIFTKERELRPPSAPFSGNRTVVVSDDGSRVFWAHTVFDEQLNMVAHLGDNIEASTPTGRYAVSATKVYDVSLSSPVLTMPSELSAVAINSTSGKLVVGAFDSLNFFPLSEEVPLTLDAPILSATVQDHVNIALNWVDRSLEDAFYVEYKKAAESIWHKLTKIDANETSYVFDWLDEGTEYSFRIRAEGREVSSEWSQTVSILNGLIPAPEPQVQVASVRPFDILLTWSSIAADFVIVEYRKVSETGEESWNEMSPMGARAGSARIDGLQPETTYEFRIHSEWGERVSEFNFITEATSSLQSPSRPVFLDVAIQEAGSILVGWEPVSYAQELILYVRQLGETDFVELTRLKGYQTSFLHTGLDYESFYSYQLVAINSLGSKVSEPTEPKPSARLRFLDDDFDSGPNLGLWSDIVGGVNKAGGPIGSTNAQFFSRFLEGMETVPLNLHGEVQIEFDLKRPTPDITGNLEFPPGEFITVSVEINYGSGWIPLKTIGIMARFEEWFHYNVSYDATDSAGESRIRWIQGGYDAFSIEWGLDNVEITAQRPLPPIPPKWDAINRKGDGSDALFWLKSERADTYLIERSLDDGHTWERLGITSELSFTAPKTPEDQVAVYRVAAQNASGTSDFSEVLRSGEVVTVTVSGHVFFLGRKERPIRQATVTLSQDGTAHQTSTNEQGYYSFQVPAGKPIEIGAALNSFSSPSRGVDVADIIGLRKHILNSSRLSDSVKWVAADANRDGSIDISDIVQMRKIILNRDDAFSRDEQGQKHSIWRLVCYDFVGLQPESAFAELSNYSVCRYEQVNADITNADFIAIKLGDSNGDWILEDTENP